MIYLRDAHMKVKHRADEELVKEGRKTAAEREALGRSFEQFRFKVGNCKWNRADLHDRVICYVAKRRGELSTGH